VLSEHGLKIAPSSYYDAKARPPSRRAVRDEDLKVEIARVHAENYGVYGPRKIWLALNREGIEVGRCTVERLMNVLGLQGIRRSKRWKTTAADPTANRPADLVKRRFNPARPNSLWLADFTYVASWVGVVYVAFVIDA
jgi:putative transposase